MIANLYYYKAKVNKIVDGDTVNLNIDLGFTISWKSNCRLAGVNAPELRAKEESVKIRAKESKQYLVESITVGSQVLIKSRELDKYGRPIIDLYYGEGFSKHLNKELLDRGFAIKFM